MRIPLNHINIICMTHIESEIVYSHQKINKRGNTCNTYTAECPTKTRIG